MKWSTTRLPRSERLQQQHLPDRWLRGRWRSTEHQQARQRDRSPIVPTPALRHGRILPRVPNEKGRPKAAPIITARAVICSQPINASIARGCASSGGAAKVIQESGEGENCICVFRSEKARALSQSSAGAVVAGGRDVGASTAGRVTMNSLPSPRTL